jgi:hypothetical protein
MPKTKTSEYKKDLQVYNQTFRRALLKQRTCNVKGCGKQAINSHVLQKNGILNGIEENGHIRILEGDFFKPNLFHFKKTGINQAFIFKGFCSEHDSNIFSTIEDYEIDYEGYRNQLLFAYRTILNEKIKKEVLLDWHRYLKESKTLIEKIDFVTLDKIDEQQKCGIKDIEYYQELIESDLINGTRNFTFQCRFTKPCEICIASHFTYETTESRDSHIQLTGNDFDILTDVSVSFFPIEDENVLIMGYLKDHEIICGNYVKSFFECFEEDLFKKLSDIILCRCEMWACSESFYNRHIVPRNRNIIEILQESASNINESRELEFNLFE